MENTFGRALEDGYRIERRRNTTELIVQKLTDMIRENSLRPGDKLPPERELAAMMEVSRPSLREALKALQMMNIIDIRQGSGAFVKTMNVDSVVDHLDIVFVLDNSLFLDLYEARHVLESEIARMAATSPTREQYLGKMEENLQRTRQLIDDPIAFLELDIEMHDLILKMANNRILTLFMQSITKLNLLARERTSQVKANRLQTVLYHQNIYDALKKGDPDLAKAAMDEHISYIRQGFETLQYMQDDENDEGEPQ